MKMTALVNRFARYSRAFQLAALAGAVVVAAPAFALTINPTFTANFNSSFGANAAAAQAAWIAAANVFTGNFNDNINVNITVDGVTGTSVFGQSNTFLYSTSYSSLRNLMVADATTSDDNLALSAGGSLTLADPVNGSHFWWVTSAQAKAIGLIADNHTADGTTTFGAGYSYTFSGPIAAGTYDFEGIAEHEISEVMGRLGLGGESIGSYANSYSLIDDFAYTGPGAKSTGNGGGRYFSLDGGTNLLKLYNNAASDGLDVVDWASGTNDAFNQFSNSGVVNGVSNVDLQLMDAIGYDRKTGNSSVPDSSATVALLGAALCGLGCLRRKIA